MAIHTKRSAEFKLQLVQEKLKGNSYGGLSKEWGVPVTQLMKWCDQYSSGCWFITQVITSALYAGI